MYIVMNAKVILSLVVQIIGFISEESFIRINLGIGYAVNLGCHGHIDGFG